MRRSTTFLGAGLLLALAAALPAQGPSLYPFGIEQDRLQGAPDFSFLNQPLSTADRVFVRDGHFYTAGGRRVRFFGVNLAFGANFPVKDDAVRVARRLRRLGINLVRLHHMDSSPDPASNPSNANCILVNGPYPTFNEVSIQRLRDFLIALSAEGIYADLNLHVGYTFRPTVDQVPTLPGQAIPDQSKPLQIFYPRMVQLQQQYTDQLIAKLSLKGDPVLAMVEINNESSLVQAWQWGQLDNVLAGEYRAALQDRWNRWLAAKYPNTASLSQAWGAGTPDGPDLLNSKWVLEQGHGKTGSLTTITTDGLPTAQVQPGQGGGWLFLKQVGFQVTAGARYLWSFQVRADLPAGQSVNVPVNVMRDVSPWDGFYNSTIKLTSEWQTFTMGVTAAFSIEDSGRVSLDVEFAPASVYARNMSLIQAGQRGLAAGESVESANISLLARGEGATPARLDDYTAFLIATDREYVNAVRDTVRAATDPLVPITGTQMGYGGLAILDSQDGLDYQDNHFYIDHYSFPNTAWDGFDWRIRDATAADSAWQSFTDMAWARPAGVPYTVSEYNQPWPNTHGSEIDPSLAAFAALQDWDGIMHFAYSHGRNWDDGVPNGFNINGDWTKFPVVGQAAWIFRASAVQTSRDALAVPVTARQRLEAAELGQSPSAWVHAQTGIARETALTRAVQLAKDGGAPGPSNLPVPKPPFVSDTGELTFDKDAKRMLVATPLVAGVFGSIGKDRATAGVMDVELTPPARGFATVLLTPLDGLPLVSSGSLLLSVPGYSLRSLPATNAQPQTLKPYPGTTDWWTIDATNSPNPRKPSGDLNGGSRPTFMERIEAYVTLRTNATAVTVAALDGAGGIAGVLPDSEVQLVPGGFRIHLNGDGQAQSPWFTIAAAQPEPVIYATPKPALASACTGRRPSPGTSPTPVPSKCGETRQVAR
jgi:hypothetical protein